MEKYIELRRDDTLESVVYTLLAAKARGEDVYCLFEGAKLHSADVTIESAKEAVAKLEASRKEHLEKLEEEARAQRERRYRDMVMVNRIHSDHEITWEKVLNGLEYIVEHQLIPHEIFVDDLLALGCNFTSEDIEKRFHRRGKISGIGKGDIVAGAQLIVAARDSEEARLIVNEQYAANTTCKEYSIQNFLRVANRKLRFRRRLAAVIGA